MIDSQYFKTEFIPATRASDQLMIVLHGKGDSSKPFRRFNEELDLNNVNFLLLNAKKKFMGGYSWYKEPPYKAEDVLAARQQVTALLNEVIEQGWKPQNIFLFGFSQGCLVSTDVALNYPKKLAGVIGVSGYFHFYPRWRNRLTTSSRKTPYLFTHGRKDDLLPIATTRFGAEKLKQTGIKVDWVEFNKAHVFKEEEYPIIRKWIRDKMKQTP